MANYYLNNDYSLSKTKSSNSKTKKKTQNNYTLQSDGTLKKTVSSGTSKSSTIQTIAPVKSTTKKKEEEKWYDGWFKNSEGTASDAVKGTGADALTQLLTGISGLGEDFLDTLAYLRAPSYNAYEMQNGGFLTSEDHKVADVIRKESEEFIKKDLYDEKEVAKKIVSGAGSLVTGKSSEEVKKYLDNDMERYSVLDEKTRGVVQSAGQLGATALLSPVVPWYVTTGMSSFGGQLDSALNDGATYNEAGMSALVTAGAEILTEKLSGGISFGSKTADAAVMTALSKKFSSEGLRALSKVGVDLAGEAGEEIASEFFSKLGTKLYKEENLKDILFSEEARNDYITAAIGGGMLGGISSAKNVVKSKATGTDVLTGYSQNEQTVFNKVLENRVQELEKQNGKKLTSKEKSKVYDEVQNAFERGEIEIDEIENILGGETLNRYNSLVEQEDSLTKKLKELGSAPNTVENAKQYESIDSQLKELQSKNEKAQLKSQLSKEVFDMVKSDSRIQESYTQRAKRGHDFTADVSKYDAKSRETIQRAIDSGILNDTRKTHEFVDLVAKLSAEKGVSFDFTSNKKLMESGFVLDGKRINGFKQGNNITINMESKNVLETVVGHEITHVLEGSPELYSALADSAKEFGEAKGIYKEMYDAAFENYKDVYKDMSEEEYAKAIEKEVTADLVAEYVFSDIEFIRGLSTKNRNVFQKVYDEIKYFLKSVTAGSDAEKKLLKVKKNFEEVYRESNSNVDEKTQYSKAKEYSANGGYIGKSMSKRGAEAYENGEKPLSKWTKSEIIDNIQEKAVENGYDIDGVDLNKLTLKELRENFLRNSSWHHTGAFYNATNFYEINEKSLNDLNAETIENIVSNRTRKSLSSEERLAKQQSMSALDNAKDIYGKMDVIFNSGITGLKSVDAIYNRWKNGKLDIDDSYQQALETIRNKDAQRVESWSRLPEGHYRHADVELYNNDMDGYANQYYRSETTRNKVLQGIKSDLMKKATLTGDVQYSISDSDGKQLTKEQQEYFKDSKVRDDNGNLKVMYHGTGDDFTVFNPMLQGGKNGTAEGYGLYFSDNTDVTDAYGGRQLKGYLNMKRPASSDAKTIKVSELEKLIKATCEKEAQRFVDDGDYDTVDEAIRDTWISNYVDTYSSNMQKAYKDVTKEILRMNSNDMDIVQEVMSGLAIRDYESAYEFYDTLKQTIGVDGFLTEWDNPDNPDKPSKIAVVFDSNQFKNIDNQNPTENPDIRYSVSQDTEGKQLTPEQSEYFKDSKVRDENGMLKVMYHGTEKGGFHEFIKDFTDDGTSFFFTDNNETAKSYSGTHENYSAKTFRTSDDFNKFFESVNADEYEVREENGQFVLYEDGDEIATSDTADGIYEEFRDWTGLGFGSANYKAYLDIKNPLIVDAEGNNWDDLDRIANGVDLGDGALSTTREYAQYAKENGYDGVIFNNIIDNGLYASGSERFKPSMVAIAFDSNQIKSVENANPTSDPDIRHSISDENQSFAPMRQGTYSKDVLLENLVQDEVTEAPVQKNAFADDYAPLTESEANMRDDRRIVEHYFPEDIPEDVDKSEEGYNGNYADHITPSDPFYEKDIFEVGKNRKQKAYMYENPEVKPFFQQEARYMMGELNNSTKGERLYNDQLYYDTNGEQGFFGTKRHTSEEIAYLLDTFGYTYKDIAKGLNAIIEDNGKENNAISKRIEFLLDERLRLGYTDFVFGDKIPPNQEYINLLNEKQINEYNDEAFGTWVQNLSEEDIKYFTQREDDIAPISNEYAPIEERSVEANKTMEEAALYDARPRRGVVEGQQSMFEESDVPKTVTRSGLHSGIMNNIKTTFKGKGLDFDEVLKKAKNLSTFSTVDNTPQRVMEKALGYKEGQVLSDLTVNKVAQNETEGIKWLNSFTDRKNGLLAQLSKQYHIKSGSKESAAAQMYAEGFYVNEANEIISYGDRELSIDFPDARVRENIKGLANDPRIRQIYDETLRMINESRTRNAYPEIPRLDNYFLHFRAMDDTFSRLGLPFNPNDIRAKDLPTDLNGVTADLKPGQPYFASAMHRSGKRTSFDLLGGMERYLTSAKNQIYHIDDIQTLRALRNYIADTYGQAQGLENLDALTEEEAQMRIEQVYNSHLSTFAKFLNEEANVLAGKTALIDRGIEGIFGRRAMQFMNTLNQQVGSNMVGYSASSALVNIDAIPRAIAKTNKADFVKGFAQFASNKIGSVFGRNDGFAEQSPVMIRRKGAERFYRTPYQKVADTGYVLMGAVDDAATEIIARTKYNELVRKGMDSQKAHFETDKWVSRLMGDRSLGQMPQLFNSKTLGLITKFQLEVRNNLDSMFYDTIQESKVSNEQIQDGLAKNAKIAAKATSTIVQLAVGQHLFGKAMESVVGYNPSFDIISVLMTALGFDDDEESEDTVLDNIEQGFLELVEDLPYASTFTGGRIPVSSALPIQELVSGKDEYGNDKSRLETLGEIAPYYVLPAGYGQIKKTKQGLDMFDEDLPVSGSYTDSGNLRFPVEDTLQNRVQAGLFGQYANEYARDYFDNERDTLKKEQIQEYKDLELPIREYWDYLDGLKKQEELEDKFEYINDLDVTTDQKNIMINNAVPRKEKIDMSNYDDFANFDEFDWYTKNTEKYNYFEEYGVSVSDYLKADDDTKDAIDADYRVYKEYPEKVTLSKAISNNWIEYRGYYKDLYDIRADKDANGKSISGTAKAKKMAYIENLNLDAGQKMILHRIFYDGKADKNEYNPQIVEYLDSRSDISYAEMVTILEELGMKVHPDGRVTW